MDASDRFDGFISYRRRDGARLAGYLARALRRYRLPRAVHRRFREKGIPAEPLRIYLDTSRRRRRPDFHDEEILPALMASHHLIIVASRSVAKPLKGGEPNPVERETRDFLRMRRGGGMFAVQRRGDREPTLPAALGQHPRLEVIDLGVPAPWRFLWAPAAYRARWAIHRCAAALYNISSVNMPHLERAAKRSDNLWRVLRAAVALVLLGGILAFVTLRARQESRDADTWAARAADARERGDHAAGARAVLAALQLRPAHGRALAERFAWRSGGGQGSAGATLAPIHRFRIVDVAGDGTLIGAVRAPERAPPRDVKGRPAPLPQFGTVDPADGTWRPFEPGVLPVRTAEPAERGAWIAVAQDGTCSIRPRGGGEPLLRFVLPAHQRPMHVAVHVATRRCWVATRDEDGAEQRTPLGRVYELQEGADALKLVKAERSVATGLHMSQDGSRITWSLVTGIVRVTSVDPRDRAILSPVEIGIGVPAQAGFVADTQRLVIVDTRGHVKRETEIGSGMLEAVVGEPVANVRPLAAAFHPVGALAAIGTREGVLLVVLDGPTQDPPAPLRCPVAQGSAVTAATFDADGMRLIVTDAAGRAHFGGASSESLRQAAAR